MPATILPVPVGKDDTTDPFLEVDEVNALGAFADLFEVGAFTAADYFLAVVPGSLSVLIGTASYVSRALVGAKGARGIASLDGQVTYDNGGAGLPASTATVWIWLKPDGTFAHTTTSAAPVTGSFLCGTCVTGTTDATSVSSAPSGRWNLRGHSVTGSRGGNAALASLLTTLAGLGLITDGTSA